MTKHDRILLNLAMRYRFEMFLRRGFLTLNPGRTFLQNWHPLAIAYQLERILRGEINRLIINLPPRSLKSLMVSVAFPAFVLGHEPHKRIFTISYGDDLANKHSTGLGRTD